MRNSDQQMELLFKALADRTRLRLLNLMGTDEVCVCFFVAVLRTNQPKISRHLAYLRRDPSFQDYLRDNGILEYWRKHGFPKQCRPHGNDAAICD